MMVMPFAPSRMIICTGNCELACLHMKLWFRSNNYNGWKVNYSETSKLITNVFVQIWKWRFHKKLKANIANGLSPNVTSNINVFFFYIRKSWTVFNSKQCQFFKVLMFWNNFLPMFSVDTTWEHQKTKGFLLFSGGLKWEHWPEIG